MVFFSRLEISTIGYTCMRYQNRRQLETTETSISQKVFVFVTGAEVLRYLI